MKTIGLVCFGLVLSSAAQAQGTQTNPDWIRRPSPEDIAAVFPRGALEAGLEGQSAITCVVTVPGTLRDCRVVRETPAGSGFGAAALALSAQFLMKPATRDGKPVESEVTIPINFLRGGRLASDRMETGSRLRPRYDTQRVVTNLPYTSAPTHEELVAAFPAKARSQKLSGRATLSCRINGRGGLDDCQVIAESPENRGFGMAARSLAKRFVAPTELDGTSLVNLQVHLPITFAAQALDQPRPVVGKPDWTALPDISDLAAVTPAKAKAAGVLKARVVMACSVGLGGALSGCSVKSEEPASLGYGEAALQLSRTFRLNVWTNEGLPTVGGLVNVPIRFDLAETESAARSGGAP